MQVCESEAVFCKWQNVSEFNRGIHDQWAQWMQQCSLWPETQAEQSCLHGLVRCTHTSSACLIRWSVLWLTVVVSVDASPIKSAEELDNRSLEEILASIPPPPPPTMSSEPGAPRLMISHIVNRNFKSYAGEQILGPFHKVSAALSELSFLIHLCSVSLNQLCFVFSGVGSSHKIIFHNGSTSNETQYSVLVSIVCYYILLVSIPPTPMPANQRENNNNKK